MNLEHKKIFEFSDTSVDLDVSPVIIQGLDGDTYKYFVEVTATASVLSNARLAVQFNTPVAGEYRRYDMRGRGTTPIARVDDTLDYISLADLYQADAPIVVRFEVSGSSGDERYLDALAGSSTTVVAGTTEIIKTSGYLKETINNLTSMRFITFNDTTTADYTIRIYQIPKGVNLDQYDLVDEVVFENRSTDIVFDGLNGDVDEEYLVQIASNGAPKLRLNGDASASYDSQIIQNNNGTLQAVNNTGLTSVICFPQSEFTIFAKSGNERLILPSLSATSSTKQREQGIWYTDTLTNVTEISLEDLSSDTGKVSLYKKKPHKTIDPVPMDTLFEYEVDGDFSAGITLNNLQGDRIEGAIKIEVVDLIATSTSNMQVKANSIVSYGDQFLQGSSSSVTAGGTTNSQMVICRGDSGEVSGGEMYVYAKSGQNRPCLVNQRYNKNGLQFRYLTINDIINEINSLDVFFGSSNSLTCKIRISVPKGTTWTTKPTLTVN